MTNIKIEFGMVVLMCNPLFLSCENKTERLIDTTEYVVEYTDSTISIKSFTDGEEWMDGLQYLKDGEYFSTTDSTLCFSTKRDTSFIDTLDIFHAVNFKYSKTEIKRVKKNLFTTTVYHIYRNGYTTPFIIYEYDSDYKIKRITDFRSSFVYK